MHVKRHLGRARLQSHSSAEKIQWVQIAQDEGRVGDRRPRRSSAVAGRAGICAGALGSNMKEAAGIHPRDASATRADAPHVDRWKACDVAGELFTQPRFSRPGNATLADQADVIAGAAGVGDDRIFIGAFCGRIVPAGNWRHRGS